MLVSSIMILHVLINTFLFASIQANIDSSNHPGLIQVLKSFQNQSTQDCVVLALKSNVEHDIEEEFQVVRITDFENINLWMREDNHGTRFDTGCMIIVTTHNNHNIEIEGKFKKLIWIFLDQVPKDKKLTIQSPVIEMLPKTVKIHCPFTEKPKLSSQER